MGGSFIMELNPKKWNNARLRVAPSPFQKRSATFSLEWVKQASLLSALSALFWEHGDGAEREVLLGHSDAPHTYAAASGQGGQGDLGGGSSGDRCGDGSPTRRGAAAALASRPLRGLRLQLTVLPSICFTSDSAFFYFSLFFSE